MHRDVLVCLNGNVFIMSLMNVILMLHFTMTVTFSLSFHNRHRLLSLFIMYISVIMIKTLFAHAP